MKLKGSDPFLVMLFLLAGIGLAGGILKFAPREVEARKFQVLIQDRSRPTGALWKVRKGDRVEVAVVNQDQAGFPYVFQVVGLDVRTASIPKGDMKRVSFVAEERGTFPVGCGCGDSHVDREATLVVE